MYRMSLTSPHAWSVGRYTQVVRVCMELQQTVALQHDCIFREGDIGDEMYFIVGQTNSKHEKHTAHSVPLNPTANAGGGSMATMEEYIRMVSTQPQYFHSVRAATVHDSRRKLIGRLSGVRLRSSTRSYGSVTPKPDSILKTSSTFSPSGGQNSMLRSNDSENSVEVVDDEAEEISQAETQMKAARFRRHKGLYQRPT
jgi:hypothetical protein